MSNADLKTLAWQFKIHLEDNDGELSYWGEKIEAPWVAGVDLRSDGPREPVVRKSLRSTPATQGSSSLIANKADALRKLEAETIGDCHLCPLGDTRNKIVFGVGNPEARVMFVGEGPGFDEDRKGEPFVGKAGQLLDKIMAAIGLNRTNAYIANIVKCHPMIDATQPDKRGNDRPPAPPEIEKCFPFLREQIAIIHPEIIMTLGATATRALLGTTQGISSLRGRMFEFVVAEGDTPIPVLPTFHPAALLRDELLKKPVWDDMKLLRSKLAGK